jgi:acyl carrier protein
MFETIKEILIDKLGVEKELINPETYIEKDLELDSTETVVIALELKKRFGINYKFPVQDITLSELEQGIDDLKNKLL